MRQRAWRGVDEDWLIAIDVGERANGAPVDEGLDDQGPERGPVADARTSREAAATYSYDGGVRAVGFGDCACGAVSVRPTHRGL